MEEKTLHSDIRFTGRVFQVEEMLVRLSDGTSANREIVRHSGGAAVVAIDTAGQVVLVRQYRKAAEQIMLEIPAGKLEPEEDPAACALRELREETGYRSGPLQPLMTLYPTPGYCSEQLHLFYTDQIESGVSAPDEGELLEPVLLPLTDCLEAIRDGRIRDAKTVVGILLASARFSVKPDRAAAGGEGGGRK
ncbi:MAG: NUDIX hydrolase [Clostridiaceae bacterium]|jgi:ADP-ribose pyrophosphatase|nr:NUDIX hydrolase [Clostridiaceae bacterium]